MTKTLKLYICNVENPTDHCRKHCLCGRGAHRPAECTKPELCDIVGEVVKCRPLTKKEMELWEERMKMKGVV